MCNLSDIIEEKAKAEAALQEKDKIIKAKDEEIQAKDEEIRRLKEQLALK